MGPSLRVCVALAITAVPWVAYLDTTPLAAQNPVYRAPLKPQKATVTILAISSILRMVSGNQDTYIAEITSSSDKSSGMVKLIDRYRGADDPIRRTWLVQLHPLEMRLLRDEGCDVEAAYMRLSHAGTDVFDRSLGPKLEEHGSELLPCFVVDHRATRLAR